MTTVTGIFVLASMAAFIVSLALTMEKFWHKRRHLAAFSMAIAFAFCAGFTAIFEKLFG